jgi:hypothetical protein
VKFPTADWRQCDWFFVLLTLLESDAQRFSQFFLTHTENDSAQSYPAPHMDIDRIWLALLRGHRVLLLLRLLDTETGAAVWEFSRLRLPGKRKCDRHSSVFDILSNDWRAYGSQLSKAK